MTREQRVRTLLTRYGDEAEWNGQKLGMHLWPLKRGDAPNRLYSCVAPASFLPCLGDVVTCAGKRYTVMKVDGAILHNERLYTSAVLELCDEWGR